MYFIKKNLILFIIITANNFLFSQANRNLIDEIISIEEPYYNLANINPFNINHNFMDELHNIVAPEIKDFNIEAINKNKDKNKVINILTIIKNALSKMGVADISQTEEGQILLSGGLIPVIKNGVKQYLFDCNIYSYLYYAIGQKLNLPIIIVSIYNHYFIRWKFNTNSYLNWETTNTNKNGSFVFSDKEYKEYSGSRLLEELDTFDKILPSGYINVVYLMMSLTPGKNNEIPKILKKALELNPDSILIKLGLAMYFDDIEDRQNALKASMVLLNEKHQNDEFEFYLVFMIASKSLTHMSISLDSQIEYLENNNQEKEAKAYKLRSKEYINEAIKMMKMAKNNYETLGAIGQGGNYIDPIQDPTGSIYMQIISLLESQYEWLSIL